MRHFKVNINDRVIIDVENLSVMVVSSYTDIVKTTQYKYKSINSLLDTYNLLKKKNLKDLTFKKHDREYDDSPSYLCT